MVIWLAQVVPCPHACSLHCVVVFVCGGVHVYKLVLLLEIHYEIGSGKRLPIAVIEV